jgi:hypothetical protein
MTIFDDRERAFEQRFVHDEEARFRALARRNRLLGEWAAAQIGLNGETARAYAGEMTRSLVAAVVDENLVRRIRADFEASGVDASEDRIRGKMAELMSQAIEQVRADAW